MSHNLALCQTLVKKAVDAGAKVRLLSNPCLRISPLARPFSSPKQLSKDSLETRLTRDTIKSLRFRLTFYP
jgi:hypothetical protein